MVIYLPTLSLCTGLKSWSSFSEAILSIDRHIDFRKIYYLFYIKMGSVDCLAKGDIFFWQNILKNRSKYRRDILEQSVVCTVLISAIIIEIFRKNIPISYIIPYKKLASPLIPVCLKKSHMSKNRWWRHPWWPQLRNVMQFLFTPKVSHILLISVL